MQRYHPLRNARIQRAASWLRWRSSIHRSQSNAELNTLQGIHAGETAVIIGNGPSINTTDLSLLEDETVFILNRGYLLFDRLPNAKHYFVCVNEMLLQRWAAEILDIDCTKFLSWPAIRHNAHVGSIMLHSCPGTEVGFSTDLRRGVWIGGTVTYVALQVAYFLGFEKVILIGVDHSFAVSGEPNAVTTTESFDENHFSPEYFPQGSAWQYPDLVTSEKAYRVALEHYQRDGREIVDATVGGKLDVFPTETLACALGKLKCDDGE